MIPQAVSKYLSPRDDPLNYPGKRPSYSFLLAKGIVFPLVQDVASKKTKDSLPQINVVQDRTGQLKELIKFLKELDVPDLKERYAIVGYGSNPVPGQLLSKFGKETVVPVLLGKLSNTDVVYNLISNMGYAFAQILINQFQVSAQIGITFLDDEQLNKMMETEQNYKLGYCPSDITLESGYSISIRDNKPVYIFAGIRKIWVPKKFAQPISVKELPSSGRKNKALFQEHILELAIEEFELSSKAISTPKQLIRRIRQESNLPEKPPKLKYYIQDSIEKNPRSLPPLSSIISLVEDKNKLQHFAL